MNRRHPSAILLLLPIAACSLHSARLTGAPAPGSADRAQVIYIVRRHWHVDVEIPTGELAPPLDSLRSRFTQARYLSFGFGDRRYLIAGNRNFPGILAALYPGGALILIDGSDIPPRERFGSDQVVSVAVSDGQLRAAQAFVQGSLSNAAGLPVPFRTGPHGDGLYFLATPSYSALYTCNTWVAHVLAAAGLPVRPRGVIFADQLWAQVRRLPHSAEPLSGTADWSRQNTGPPLSNSAER
jgi:hypothetical protein